VLRRQIEQYNETVSRYQRYQHQQHHLCYQHEEQQQHGELMDSQQRRTQAAPTDVVQALLDISSTLPPSTTVNLPPDTSYPGH